MSNAEKSKGAGCGGIHGESSRDVRRGFQYCEIGHGLKFPRELPPISSTLLTLVIRS
jgi:hypothetical protein